MSGKLIEELRANATAHPLDFRLQCMADAADALEAQAREIERQSRLIDGATTVTAALMEELAAMKAQPDPWQASGADWCRSIHSNPDAKAWADFFVAVFPGQADKHELMIGWFANAMMAMHDHLKAQSSGVVLPDHRDSDLRSPAHEYSKGWNACLDEVARLNSSPVSAGESSVVGCSVTGRVEIGVSTGSIGAGRVGGDV